MLPLFAPLVALGPTVSAAPTISEYPLPANYVNPTAMVSAGGSMWYFNKNSGSGLAIGNITASGTITNYRIRFPDSPILTIGERSLTVDSTGRVWFGGCAGATSSTQKIVFGYIDPSAPAITYIQTTVGGCGYLQEVGPLTVDTNGNIWILEHFGTSNGYSVVFRFGPDGTSSYSWAPTPANHGWSGITTGPNNTLWLTDTRNGKIDKLTLSSTSTVTGINAYAIPTPNSGPGNIIAGPDGNLWFGENTNKVGKITPNGVVTEYTLSTDNNPYNFTVGPDGAVWFTGYLKYIGRITTAGTVTEYTVPTSNSFPNGIAAGPDNAVWFTEWYGNKIGRISAAPSVPTSLTLTTPSPTKYPGLSWSSASGANNYNIYRNGTLIDTIGSNNTTYTDATAPEGSNVYYISATNGTGESATSNSVPVLVDRTAPTITYGVAPVADNDGYNTGNVTVTFTCNDALSGVASCSDPVTVGDEGVGHTVTGTATDNAGNTATVNASASLLAQAVNAGGGATDSYVADTGFSGGSTYTSTATVDSNSVITSAPQAVYQSTRYGNNMSYTFSGLNPNAPYTLLLNFNEPYWGTPLANGGGVGSRVFNIAVNGQSALSNFDVYQTAGGANKALNEQVAATADASGTITIEFTSVTDNAIVSGLALYNGTLPSLAPDPTPTPVSSMFINAGGTAAGNFVTDTGYLGGTQYSSTASVDTSNATNPAPEAVYQSVRYGNFSYTVPNLAPNTNFLVRLHFNELYWNAAGNRVFNVSINGSPALANYDIYQATGDKNKAVIEDFVASSDAQGKIVIQFTSVTGDAMVSGIEIVPPILP